jgi:biotin carboxylase
MQMPRVLLVLPTATYRAPDFLDAARSLGAEVVVGSEEAQAMGEAMGDRAVTVDLCDPVASADSIVAVHGRSPFDAVIGVDEQGVLVAAEAAARLGFPHNPADAVAITRNKARMREVLTKAGLRQPRFEVVSDDAVFVRGTSYVVKATSLSGSRGVIRADTPDDAVAAVDRVRAIMADAGEDGPVLAEEYVPGAEVAVEGLLRGGELRVLAIFDKPDPLEGPYFEETIYVTPSRLDDDVQDAIAQTVRAACAAIGLVEGPIHAELRLPAGDPVLLEVAARSIGGLCSRALRFGAGISLEEVIVRHALRMRLGDLHRTLGASGVMMIPIPRSGVLRAVHGTGDARGVADIDGVEITVPVDQTVKALPEGDRYLGFVFATAPTPSEVEAALRAAHAQLRIEID